MQKQLIILAILSISVLAGNDFWSPTYQAQSRTQKYSQLIQQIQADTTSGSYPSAVGLGTIFIEDMETTMKAQIDQLPILRKKLIHSVGNTAGVKFIATPNTPYTGLFKGADSAIIRLSCAKGFDKTKSTAKEAFDNFTPGFGLKFLIDGKPSANLVAMFGVNGVDTWNFFGRDFSNHIPGASGAALTAVATKFATATNHVTTVGLKTFAEFNQKGEEQSNIKFPWRLIFRAPDALKNQFTDDYSEDYQVQLARIPVGKTLYDVFAIDDPTVGACEQKIGSIVLTTKLLPSKFGDEQLFFQHQKMEDDLALKPAEFTRYTSNWKSAFENNDPELTEKACPFKNH